MRTLQYTYFAIKSVALSAEDVAGRLRMAADEVMVLGSRDAERRLPRCHAWKIVRRSGESVDDQIQHLVDRLRPVRDRLVPLVTDFEVSPVMQVVRYFHHDDGIQGHRPLGWHLPLPVLEFLTATRTTLDVDEYDFSDDR